MHEPDDAACHTTHGYMTDKAKYLARLKRIEGQVRGIHRMVDEEKYCIEILTQVAAAKSALESIAVALLEDHMRHCVADAVQQGGDEADAKIKEATAAVVRLLRS